MTASDRKKNPGLIGQVMFLFAIAVLVTGVITFIAQRSLADSDIRQHTEERAAETAEEAAASVREYPAYEWLLSYLYSHADEMDIEYDAGLGPGTETEEKCGLLNERYPGMQLRYAEQQEIEAMQPEDQKLYAEIVCSWLIARLDQVKNAYDTDYLFFAAADEECGTQFFLLSAAGPGDKRGTEYGEIYPAGHTVTVGKDQQEAMRSAKQNVSGLADAGDYVDHYTWFGETQGQQVFIGMTYDLSGIRSQAAAQARRDTICAMLFQIFLSVICLLIIWRFVLDPLEKVQQNIRIYKEDKDSTAITESLRKIRTRGEIRELSDDVSALAAEIDDYVSSMERITAEKERISTELSLAAGIQAAMMPHTFPPFPGRNEFDIRAFAEPAREVGGDFYDFFLTDDDHLCMVIADVSGKGIPAALFAMACKIMLKSCVMPGGSPAEILTRTNKAVCADDREDMFLTVWLGILEISAGRLTAANAGHEYPALKRTPESPFEVLKDRHGFVIGGMPDMKYSEYELQLEPGAKLFLYTDGVREAADAEGNMYGTGRMLAALNGTPDTSPEQLLKNVRASVEAFAGKAERSDDLAMLCVEYRGTGHER